MPRVTEWLPKALFNGTFYLLAFIFVLEWLSLPFMVSRLNKKMGQFVKLKTSASETSGKLLESMDELKSIIRDGKKISRNHPDGS